MGRYDRFWEWIRWAGARVLGRVVIKLDSDIEAMPCECPKGKDPFSLKYIGQNRWEHLDCGAVFSEESLTMVRSPSRDKAALANVCETLPPGAAL